MNSKIYNIGVLILTKNEEKNIGRCLESCKNFSEIIVIDSGSTDKTSEIVQKYTSQIYVNPFINFLEQRKFGLQKIASDWVLMLDADETINEALELELIKMSKQNQFFGLKIPRKNYFLGKWIEHCNWYPDYQLRFFQKSASKFAPNKVHEKVIIYGKIKELPKKGGAFLDHHTTDNLSNYFNKMNLYTTLEAEEYEQTNIIKISRLAIFTRSLGMFTQTFFHYQGYKDGMRGFIISMINFINSFLMMAKIWELREKK
jgi:glycosyltransferase involved in cell wall biosynthesis